MNVQKRIVWLWPKTAIERNKPMKRTFTLIPAALAAAALFGGLVHAVLVAAQVAEPAATTTGAVKDTKATNGAAALLLGAGALVAAVLSVF